MVQKHLGSFFFKLYTSLALEPNSDLLLLIGMHHDLRILRQINNGKPDLSELNSLFTCTHTNQNQKRRLKGKT